MFFLVVLTHLWTHFRFHKLADGVAYQFLVVGERKIHRFASNRDASTPARIFPSSRCSPGRRESLGIPTAIILARPSTPMTSVAQASACMSCPIPPHQIIYFYNKMNIPKYLAAPILLAL